MALAAGAAGADRRADDHQVGVLAGVREVGAAMVGELQLVGEWRPSRRCASPTTMVLGEAALAGAPARSSRRSGRCRSARSCRTRAALRRACRPTKRASEASHRLHLGLGADGDAQMLGQAVARDHARDQPVVHHPVVGRRGAFLRAEADQHEVADARQRLQAELAQLGAEPAAARCRCWCGWRRCGRCLPARRCRRPAPPG